jgi:hypothetical protein
MLSLFMAWGGNRRRVMRRKNLWRQNRGVKPGGMADSPAARQRRRRARWKAGLGTAIAEFDWFVVTELLIVEGLLTERDIDDRRRVGEALSRWLSNVTRNSAYRRRRGTRGA